MRGDSKASDRTALSRGMRSARIVARVLSLALVTVVFVASGVPGEVRAERGAADTRTYEFVNGLWFDGTAFRRRTYYSVHGRFTRNAPDSIDQVVDLANGYVLPPFADAHTHHFDNPENVEQHVDMYLEDGVFYAKVQTDVRSRALRVTDRVNHPHSVDVSYSHGGLSVTHGHPLAVYEGLALYRQPGDFDQDQIEEVRESRLRNEDAYYIIDTREDLETKWPAIIAGAPDFIKVYLLHSEEYADRRDRTGSVGDRGLSPELVPHIVEKANAAGLRVSAHVTTAFDYRVALQAGVDEMAHLPGYRIAADDDPRKYRLTEEDAMETARRGTWVVPAPAYLDVFVPDNPEFDAAVKARTEAVRRHNLKLLRRHGVKIAVGSDAFGRSPVDDVLYLGALGIFSNLELLRIWCEDTPRTIFPKRRLGRLAEGYEASFVVLNGDPVDDLAQVEQIRLRFKQGYLLDDPLGSRDRAQPRSFMNNANYALPSFSIIHSSTKISPTAGRRP